MRIIVIEVAYYLFGVLVGAFARAVTIGELPDAFFLASLTTGATILAWLWHDGQVRKATVVIGHYSVSGPGLWGKRHRLGRSNLTLVQSAFRRLIGQVKVKAASGQAVYIQTRYFSHQDVMDMLQRLGHPAPLPPKGQV